MEPINLSDGFAPASRSFGAVPSQTLTASRLQGSAKRTDEFGTKENEDKGQGETMSLVNNHPNQQKPLRPTRSLLV